jgi:hypothetical protein
MRLDRSCVRDETQDSLYIYLVFRVFSLLLLRYIPQDIKILICTGSWSLILTRSLLFSPLLASVLVMYLGAKAYHPLYTPDVRRGERNADIIFLDAV